MKMEMEATAEMLMSLDSERQMMRRKPRPRWRKHG
jgi:hypothetical protein